MNDATPELAQMKEAASSLADAGVANSNKPDFIIFHCSAVSAKTAPNQFTSINNYHKSEGFPKSSLGLYVGYHVLITGGGKYVCREDTDEGSHCNNFPHDFRADDGKTGPLIDYPDKMSMNFHSLAICIGFDGDAEFPPAADAALFKDQVRYWMAKYGIPFERVRFHREFCHVKTCPGSLITRDWLKTALGIEDPRPEPSPAPLPPDPAPEPVRLPKPTSLEQLFMAFLSWLTSIFNPSNNLSSSMNESNATTYPAWYESTEGPGVSTTIANIALNILPVANILLGHWGLAAITGQSVSDIVSTVIFVFFSARAAYGYIRAKITLGQRIAAANRRIVDLCTAKQQSSGPGA